MSIHAERSATEIRPGRDEIRRAAEVIRAGGLVGMPTETVYGLAANALDPAAVARIYQAKGRPSTSPLIVHVDSVEMARTLAAEWPAAAERLASRYWPGPLTLVAPKTAAIPDIVTAGLDTVGLRMPSHPVALELIRESRLPLAAPSANRFMGLSPTTAAHVREGLGDVVAIVLDGGPCEVGIESAVVSVAGERPVLLRPGSVGREEMERLVGPFDEWASEASSAGGADPSPGMHRRHYSPRTPLVLGAPPAAGRGAWIYWRQPRDCAMSRAMPGRAAEYASALYGVLHEVDRERLDWIAVEPVPGGPEWAGVRDRLNRAAAR